MQTLAIIISALSLLTAIGVWFKGFGEMGATLKLQEEQLGKQATDLQILNDNIGAVKDSLADHKADFAKHPDPRILENMQRSLDSIGADLRALRAHNAEVNK